jgi:hypothetical protein
VSVDDWALALHVLSAFAWVAGIILFWVSIVAVRRTGTVEGTIRMAPLVRVGNAAVGVGMVGTIVLGVWLAFSEGLRDLGRLDRRGAGALGDLDATRTAHRRRLRTRDEQGARAANGRADRAGCGAPCPQPNLPGVIAHFLWSLVVLLILLDMIWKPGA